LDSLGTLLVIRIDIVLLLVLSAIAVSSLLLFDLEFDFIYFLLPIRVTMVSATLSYVALAGRDRHDAY
jgi:hypothetical protein